MSLTPKQEAFAQAYHETSNASEAYRRAYDVGPDTKATTITRKAHDVLMKGNVAARLSELQRMAQERHNITIDSLTEMTLKAYAEAQRIAPTTNQMQTASMIKAAEFLGKLHGLVVDKSEVTGKDGTPLVPVLNVSVTRNQS